MIKTEMYLINFVISDDFIINVYALCKLIEFICKCTVQLWKFKAATIDFQKERCLVGKKKIGNELLVLSAA